MTKSQTTQGKGEVMIQLLWLVANTGGMLIGFGMGHLGYHNAVSKTCIPLGFLLLAISLVIGIRLTQAP